MAFASRAALGEGGSRQIADPAGDFMKRSSLQVYFISTILRTARKVPARSS
jgi:hypothetical protein